MTPSRFAHIKVLERAGERIAQLHDTEAGRDLFVVRRDGAYLHWDRGGRTVENEALRQSAAVALGHGLKDRAIAGVASRSRPLIEAPKRPERNCERCELPFIPKSPGSKVCPTCRSEAARRESFQAKADRTARAVRALVSAVGMDSGADDVRGLACDDLIALRYTKRQVLQARAGALDGFSVDQILEALDADREAVAA